MLNLYPKFFFNNLQKNDLFFNNLKNILDLKILENSNGPTNIMM